MLLLAASAMGASAQVTPASQMEKLDRGVVAVRPSWTNYVSWRMLGTDSEGVTFDLYRDGQLVKEGIRETFVTDNGTKDSKYKVVAKLGSEVVDESKETKTWDKYLTLQLDCPTGSGCTYTPNDMSVGDVDGDGEYELFVKWDPSNSQDNSVNGKTGNVFIDCYKLDGTKLWRIDLGVNIRAGAHYTQFMVYDFDRDGKAEMICKTGPGSMDATGKYVNLAATDNAINSSSVDNKKDWRNSNGRITGGQEYLTVFRGLTGEALHTIFYNPNRNMTYGGAADGSANWGEPDGKSDKASYGNRGERFLAAVAYLDGPTKPASGIFCRGYYGYAFIWAVGFDGEHLYQKWLNEAKTKTSYYLTTFNAEGQGTKKAYTGCKPTSGSGSGTTFANGNHNMSIADVDGDGCDEVIWGSAAVNNDGTLLYGTGFGHGDAIHLGRMIPDRDGFQVFQVHEEKGTYSWDLHDAFTGEIIFKGGSAGVDNGRGMAADIDAKNNGWEFWSGDERNPRSAVTGAVVIQKNPSVNFRIYWDGDLQDELFDGAYDSKTTYMAYPKITKWNGSSLTTLKEFGSADGTPQTCNSTKATPCLQADILGDWREELVMWNYSDPSKIMIYTTTSSTNYRIPTLMHDHTYRMGVCWQNTAYNQPPHVGFCLKDFVDGKLTAISDTKTAERNEASGCYNLQGQHIEKPAKGLYIRNGKKYVAR